MKRTVRIVILLVLGAAGFSPMPARAQMVTSNVPYLVPYQGQLADDLGRPVDRPDVSMTFRLYTVASGPEAAWWTETQTVAVTQGVYSVVLGASTPLPPNNPVWAGEVWLEVEVDGQVLAPRQRWLSAPYALMSEQAIYADDAALLQGRSPAQFDQSAHVADTANPHGVTAAQTGAATPADVAAHAADPAAHHAKTTSFTDLTDQASDAQIPAGVARDSELTWGNLSGVPVGFADGVDNVGISSEDDPQVGTNALGYVPKWTGSALESGTLFEDGAGKVGVGTDVPSARLHVANTAIDNTPGKHTLDLTESNNRESGVSAFDPTKPYYGLGFLRSWNNTNMSNIKRIAGVYAYGAQGYRGGLVFKTENNVLPSENPDVVAMVIRPDGNVGVGTNSPAARLSVEVQDAAIGSPAAFSAKNAQTGAYGTLGFWGTDNSGPYGLGVYGNAGSRGWAGWFTGDVKVNGTGSAIEFPDGSRQTKAYTGVGFPRPNYDSGWVAFDWQTGLTLTHNLGGTVDDYVVDLTFKEGTNINNRGIGMDSIPLEPTGLAESGTYWKWLNTTQIQIGANRTSSHVDQIRVRIWVYQ